MRIPRIEPPQLGALTRRMPAYAWIESSGADLVLIHDLNAPSMRGISGLETMRALIKRCMDKLPPGGKLGAVARCCDSGIELAELLVKAGTDIDVSNLTNREIAILKPSSVVFLSHTHRYRPTRDPKSFVEHVFPGSVVGEITCKIPYNFAVKTLDAGIIWTKE